MSALLLRRRRGPAHPLAIVDWTAPATVAERDILSRLDGPVLDIGCGPGRLVVALGEHGTISLGVDPSPAAADHVVARGGAVLCRSVFDPIPGEGRWRTVLLFDGNIGIGGDPVRLLRRSVELLHGQGSMLVETDPPGSVTELTDARVEVAEESGPWFPWAWVAADRLAEFATDARLTVTDWLHPTGRWIARLEPAAP